MLVLTNVGLHVRLLNFERVRTKTKTKVETRHSRIEIRCDVRYKDVTTPRHLTPIAKPNIRSSLRPLCSREMSNNRADKLIEQATDSVAK